MKLQLLMRNVATSLVCLIGSTTSLYGEVNSSVKFEVFAEAEPGDPSLPYAYYDDQEAVLVKGIDFEATLKIAANELAKKDGTSVLTIWAIRDQIVTPEIALQISDLYLQYVDGLYEAETVRVIYDWNFALWHFSWAIANLYRNGDDAIKNSLETAYQDALVRPATLKRFQDLATDHVSGDRILMGDIHEAGRGYAQTHIVVPGNLDYIQSFDDYLQNQNN